MMKYTGRKKLMVCVWISFTAIGSNWVSAQFVKSPKTPNTTNESLTLQNLVAKENAVAKNSATAKDSVPTKRAQKESSRVSQNYYTPNCVLSSSAFQIPKGTVQYQNYAVLFNEVQFGMGHNVGISCGIFLPKFIYIIPKYSIIIQRNHTFAIADLATFSVYGGSKKPVWGNSISGIYTYGTPQNNLSLGIGMLRSSELEGASMVNTFSGMLGLAPNLSIVAEAWYNHRKQPIYISYSDWIMNATGIDYSERKIEISKNFNRNTVCASLQFRLIRNKEPNSSWSFGVSSFWQSGESVYKDIVHIPKQITMDRVVSVMPIAIKKGPKNLFVFLPSFTYVKKFQKAR